MVWNYHASVMAACMRSTPRVVLEAHNHVPCANFLASSFKFSSLASNFFMRNHHARFHVQVIGLL